MRLSPFSCVSASSAVYHPRLLLHTKNRQLMNVGQLCGLTHHRRLPPSQSAVLHIHTKVLSGIQRSILVLMVAFCVGGKELRVISTSDRTINVVGIDSHMLQSLPICTLLEWWICQIGPIMCYFHQYAYHANGHTIHSKVQLMDYGNVVDDSPIKLGGTQKIVTPCGITMPLDVSRGIAYLKLRRPTDD